MRIMLKASLVAARAGLVQVKRWRTIAGHAPHWATYWVRHEDLTAEERGHLARQEVHQRSAVQPHEEMVDTQLRTDAARVWQLYTTGTYASGDLPVIAAREALQNSRDAIGKAMEAGNIKRGEFRVDYDPETGTLAFADNGIGMDHAALHKVFLTLGGSGKLNDPNSAGGFGVAKAVILGCSPTGDWEIHSRDNWVPSHHLGTLVPLSEQKREWRQGTKITVRGFSGDQSKRDHERADGESVPLIDRLRDLLGSSNLDGTDLYLNGQKLKPFFNPERGTPIPREGHWGDGSGKVTLTQYRRRAGSGNGAYYVRINGLVQHRKPPSYGIKLDADVVVDLAPTVRPGETDYPFTTSRDDLKGEANGAFYDFRKGIEKETKKDKNDRKYDTFLPDGDDAEKQGHDEFSAAMGDFMGELSTHGLMKELLGTINDVDRHEGSLIGSRSGTYADPDRKEVGSSAPGLVVDKQDTGRQRTNRFDEVDPGEAPKRDLDWDQTRQVERDAEHRIEQQFEAGGAGLAGAVAVMQELSGVRGIRPINPFKNAAIVKVSRKDYDRRKAKRFMEKPAEAMPVLLAWDAACRMIAKEYRFREKFRTGFALDDSVHALASVEGNGQAYVLIQPDRVREWHKAHKDKPNGALSLATMLHGLAAHELSHLPRMWAEHDESFSVAREDMGLKTAHMIPAIAEAVGKALPFTPPKTAHERQIDNLQKEVAKLKAKIKADAAKQVQTQETITAPQLSLFGGGALRKGATDEIRRRSLHRGDEQPATRSRPARSHPGDPRGDRGHRAGGDRGGAVDPARDPRVVDSLQRARAGDAGGDRSRREPGAHPTVAASRLVFLRKAEEPKRPPGLVVEAARVDARLREHGDKMETLHAQLVDKMNAATSPTERAEWRKLAHELHEVAGAVRYSAVTGQDDSDLG